MPEPTREAMRVARTRLLVRDHTMARKTRPPSSGKPGSRLNAPSTKLIHARYAEIVAKSLPRKMNQTAPKISASAHDISGPATATRNSCFAVFISSPRLETPPKMNSVIDGTDMPSDCATNAWDNSCRRTERKNTSEVMSAAVQRSLALQLTKRSLNTPSASDHATRAKMRAHDQCTRMAMPRIRPRTRPELRSMRRAYAVAPGRSRLRAR